MADIFWDTNLFIYLFEKNPVYLERVVSIRKRMVERGDTLSTSTLSMGEILVKPVQSADHPMVERYTAYFQSTQLKIIPFDHAAAQAYARIRADRSISRPDAIQLACAASRKTDLFITNDLRLAAKVIPGIQFISSLDSAPL